MGLRAIPRVMTGLVAIEATAVTRGFATLATSLPLALAFSPAEKYVEIFIGDVVQTDECLPNEEPLAGFAMRPGRAATRETLREPPGRHGLPNPKLAGSSAVTPLCNSCCPAQLRPIVTIGRTCTALGF